jgi:hypothetical protein
MSSKLAIAAVLFIAALADAATLVRQLPLEEVTQQADRIVHARVVAVQSGRDASGLAATWVTLEVKRTLKGAGAEQLVVKQFGAATPLADGAVGRIAGLPAYAAGEELVLFLRAPSARGFSSPVGLGQGVYRVRGSAQRRTVAADLSGKQEALDVFLSKVATLSSWGR